MTTFAAALKQIESVSIPDLAKKAAKDTDFLSEVTDAVRNQWEQGLNSKGEKIGRYQSGEYAQFKFEMNARAGRGFVDLMLTHALEKNLKATVEGEEINIDSGDWKAQMIRERYGNEVFGLTKESKEGDLSYILGQKIIKELTNVTPFKTT